MNNPILDFIDDGGELFRRLYPTLDTVPEFVKTSELVDPECASKLDDGHFALVVEVGDGAKLRKFATVDLGNTFISALYLNVYGDALPPDMRKQAAVNIERAFQAYGYDMPESLKGNSMEKTSSAYTDGMFVPDMSEEVTMHDAVRASEDFDMFYSNIPPLERRPLAKSIVKMASVAGVSTSERAMDLSADRTSTFAPYAVRARIECTEDPIAKVTYEKLASILESDEKVDPDDAITLLYEMDKRAGLTDRYGMFIPEPATAIMKGANVGGMAEQPPGVIYRDTDTGKSMTSDRYMEMLEGDDLDDIFEEDVKKDLIAAGEGGFDVLPISLQTAIGRRA